MTKFIPDDDVDWTSFDSILNHSLRYWPSSVRLSPHTSDEGWREDYIMENFEKDIDWPYLESGQSKHIVRLMLWSIYCGVPRDLEGQYNLVDVLDFDAVKRKFESDVKEYIDGDDADAEEIAYANANLV